MHRPKPQELYRHFKGGKYQVITIARDADTGEEQVVYQALYGDYTVYTRKLSEFTSEVDRNKYPNADQKMRFELFTPYENEDDREEPLSHKEEPAKTEVSVEKKPEEKAAKNSDYMNKTIEEEAEELGMNPLVVEFLDADSCAKRLEILNLLRPTVTNDMIDIMAMAMDTDIQGDDPDDRCAELRECLLTKQRFEVSRLRQ